MRNWWNMFQKNDPDEIEDITPTQVGEEESPVVERKSFSLLIYIEGRPTPLGYNTTPKETTATAGEYFEEFLTWAADKSLPNEYVYDHSNGSDVYYRNRIVAITTTTSRM